MAKKEIMIINDGGSSIEAANIDYTVGLGGANRSPDVMLVQALFRYISLDRDIARRFLGSIEVPQITGFCGPKTRRAINQFQHKHAHSLLRVDGVIHPASYGRRKISTDASKPVMTITLLHRFAWDAMLWQPDIDYVSGLIRIEPRLRPFLNRVWHPRIDI